MLKYKIYNKFYWLEEKTNKFTKFEIYTNVCNKFPHNFLDMLTVPRVFYSNSSWSMYYETAYRIQSWTVFNVHVFQRELTKKLLNFKNQNYLHFSLIYFSSTALTINSSTQTFATRFRSTTSWVNDHWFSPFGTTTSSASISTYWTFWSIYIEKKRLIIKV